MMLLLEGMWVYEYILHPRSFVLVCSRTYTQYCLLFYSIHLIQRQKNNTCSTGQAGCMENVSSKRGKKKGGKGKGKKEKEGNKAVAMVVVVGDTDE